VWITVNVSEGDYQGMLTERAYWFEVHYPVRPDAVLRDNEPLLHVETLSELKNAPEGWCYDPAAEKGLVYVKTPSLPTDTPFTVLIDLYVGTGDTDADPRVRIFPNPADDKLHLHLAFDEAVDILLFDSLFREVVLEYQGIPGTGKVVIGMADQPEGTYFVMVGSKKERILKKVVVIH
jgi:hypothetical protein